MNQLMYGCMDYDILISQINFMQYFAIKKIK